MEETRWFGCILVLESFDSMSNVERRLTTLEPRRDLSMLLLALVTTSRRLSVSR